VNNILERSEDYAALGLFDLLKKLSEVFRSRFLSRTEIWKVFFTYDQNKHISAGLSLLTINGYRTDLEVNVLTVTSRTKGPYFEIREVGINSSIVENKVRKFKYIRDIRNQHKG
jgi:hypothetical protein